jgi:DNA-binding GntR family transcriptional regulator
MPNLTHQKEEPQDNGSLIFRVLKDEIVNLVIPPGAPLGESEICARFSVSRTPVRTALLRLSDIKLIRIVPYKGIYVNRINLHQLKQMIYMRTAIESKVIRDFIDVFDSLVLEKIRYLLRKQSIQVESNCTPEEFYKADAAFHRIWFKTMDKEFLWNKIQHAQVHYTRFRMLDMVKVKNLTAIIKEHEQLFNIIAKKKKDAVEPFMDKHLNGGINRLGKRIQSEFSGYFEPEPAQQ